MLLKLPGELLLTQPDQYMQSTGFKAKMIMTTILIINGIMLNFYTTSRLTTFNFSSVYPKHDAAWRARKLSFIFGAISVISWYSILFTALLKTVIKLPLFGYVAIYLVLVFAAVIMSLVLEKLLVNKIKAGQSKQTKTKDYRSLTIEELSNLSSEEYKTILKNQPNN